MGDRGEWGKEGSVEARGRAGGVGEGDRRLKGEKGRGGSEIERGRGRRGREWAGS